MSSSATSSRGPSALTPPPLKGEEGRGLRPEHFSDPSARAAYELIAAADTTDPAADLQGRLQLMNCRGQGGCVREAILSRVKALKPDFVIIDPRYKLMRPDEDENTGSGLIGILNLLDAIAEEGAAVMIVGHDKKGDVKGQDIRDRGAGSNWAARDVDCRFVMTPKKNDDYGIEVGILARNYPPRPSLDLKAESGRFATGGIR